MHMLFILQNVESYLREHGARLQFVVDYRLLVSRHIEIWLFAGVRTSHCQRIIAITIWRLTTNQQQTIVVYRARFSYLAAFSYTAISKKGSLVFRAYCTLRIAHCVLHCVFDD